uniref:Uncharacterized protein n=1 Tax=Anguilla anguilla TaxID=7936 RepID=A0A0E9X1W2_ANGAN
MKREAIVWYLTYSTLFMWCKKRCFEHAKRPTTGHPSCASSMSQKTK